MRIAAFKEAFVRVPNARSCASRPFSPPATLTPSQGFIITSNYSWRCLGIKKTWSCEDETGGANVTCRDNLWNNTGLTNLMSGALKLTSRHLVSTNVDQLICQEQNKSGENKQLKFNLLTTKIKFPFLTVLTLYFVLAF